jgi:hypothetical protein
MLNIILKWVLIGVLGGAAFGVAFGIIASMFRNGPTPLQGITESWWWFALIGCCMALGHARAHIRDEAHPTHTFVRS